MTFDCKFSNKENGYSVIIDDDGYVAYAYLLDETQRVVSDVWLYNRCSPPEEPEWRNQCSMPFANSIEFVKEKKVFDFIRDLSEVSVIWSTKELVEARINVRGTLFAVLIEGSKPGWSYLTKKDGPLSKVLEVRE